MRGAPARVGGERGDGDEVVGIGGVPQAEREREQQDDERAVTRRVAADEVVEARHWTIH
jgi:hypothetical protein